MRGKTRLVAAFGALGVLVLVAAFASSSSAAGGKTVVHVIEHATSDTVVDIGGTGDTSGDLLTFANPVYDETDENVVGRDMGTCVRIDPAKGSWQCSWTAFLDGGQLTVSGPFYDTRDSVLAVIGGTGGYSNATGSMQLKSREGGTKYDFIFRISV